MGALHSKANTPTLFDMNTMETLRAGLDGAKGRWPRIAEDIGVDHSTIARIARGEIETPRIDTVEKIQGWLREHAAPEAA